MTPEFASIVMPVGFVARDQTIGSLTPAASVAAGRYEYAAPIAPAVEGLDEITGATLFTTRLGTSVPQFVSPTPMQPRTRTVTEAVPSVLSNVALWLATSYVPSLSRSHS